MILDDGEDKDGKFFKASLIDRYALTLENYAGSAFGNKFYSTEFLEGFCARSNEAHVAVGKSSGGLIFLTVLLAFFQNLQGEVQFWGITFSVPELGALALCLSISVTFFVVVCSCIDQLILDRFLDTLGNRIGTYNFEILLLEFTSKNLWASAITPHYHGLASGSGHRRGLIVFTLFLALFSLVLGGFPLMVVGSTIWGHLTTDPSTLELILSGIAIFSFLVSLVILLLFSISFRFRPSGFSEPSEPFVPMEFVEMGHPSVPFSNEDKSN